MNMDTLMAELGQHVERLQTARADIGDSIAWYPYDILANIVHIDGMLTGEQRDLDALAGGLPVADIGAADGDLAFTLEAAGGWEMDIIDTAPTNMNGLDGARALRDHFGSRVGIYDLNLDQQFSLPRERYGLVLLLGILYHLQNPYYALRALAASSRHLLLSTKVARFAGSGAGERSIADLPVGYLVAPDETNNDPTNYWVMTPVGLERLVDRAGWDVLASRNVGDTKTSHPASMERDERQFMLLRSRLAS